MGITGISVSSLLIILLIVMLVFGTKRLRTIGQDLGAAIKSFREGIQDNKNHEETPSTTETQNESRDNQD